AERQLSAEQIALLKRWIKEGAQWEGHWAFEPVKRPALPQVSQPQWLRNSIDAFVLAKLDQKQMSTSQEASPETLLRRVTLDLTGLPPTPEEIDAYLVDSSPDRYDRLIDRLLASPSYGEHMAVAWLDAARYADTSGYQTDGSRDMSRWRDWLIDALNAGQPFDQFTIEMLAGDLLPNATLDQRIATGFHRNHRANSEGGSIPEEFLVEYVVDRVDTTGTVWLGLTIGCARCHDHKYDPISQKDYYQLFAYFNSVPESGRALKEGNSPPYLLSPNAMQQQTLSELNARIADAEASWQLAAEQRLVAQREWEQAVRQREESSPIDWTIAEGLLARFPLESDLQPSVMPPPRTPETTEETQGAPASFAMSFGETEFVDEERPALRLNGEQFVEAGDLANFNYFDEFTVSAWVKPRGEGSGGIVSRSKDGFQREGWALHVENGRVQMFITKRWLDDALRVETQAQLIPEEWQHVVMIYDGSRAAQGVRIFINGMPQEQTVLLDVLNQSMETDEPLRLGSTGATRPFAGDIADVRVYDRVLSEDEIQVVSVAEPVDALIAKPGQERTLTQAAKVREYFLRIAGPDDITQPYAERLRLQSERKQFMKQIPTTMVMVESPEPRETFVLSRGSYERPTEPVSAAVPDVLNRSPQPVGSDRLALAQWLVDPAHPLTSRVTVNREWQRFFGVGLVKTSEDFGIQGERPSHPDLLDWLASEFVSSGWDTKSLHRLIVTSASYRQSSVASPEQMAVDPQNRLLGRGPRFRMTAETIRDVALAASGLLQRCLGGASVKPYQPDGLWSEIASDAKYEQSMGPDLYRRSLYSFVKRTVGNPTLSLFDATTRETCTVRRSRTNTPLQALTLMNDVTFVEAARVLAERAMGEEDTIETRIASIFIRAAGRRPSQEELAILKEARERHHRHFAADTQDTQALLDVGESPVDPALDPAELAAYTSIASVILNLDEVVTKE
ncbi:MAG: DUF1553 domain-containing protein, partial [Planctomycetaceae bacterium]|nr:DUF1553 domain-containing protein [Planctomycetaceae bacterium]